MADTNATMADIRSRIQKQQQMMKGYQALRSASGNPDVQRQADSNIRDAQRNISYLEESLQALINRRASSMGPKSGGSVSSGISSSAGAYNSTSSGGPTPFGSSQASFQSSGSSNSIQHQQQQQQAPGAGRGFPGDAASAYLQQQRNPNDPSAGASAAGYASADGYGGGMTGRGGEWQPAPINRMGTSARRNYTNLDLIKADTPLTTAKISRMLHHIEFKLQIEKQYKQGIDKMAALYQAEGDRKSRSDAESKRVESQSKIMLLQQALKRYKQLHVMDDENDNDGQSSSIEGRRQDLRKPLSGTLQISVKAARDLEHAPTQRLGRSVRESTVVFKVEDAARARTHPSRTDRWQDDFEFAVDNANEIEVTVYDKVGSGHPIPVGMLWIRLSDVVEELRKKKFGQPGAADGGSAAASGWVTAGDVQQQAGGMMGGASAGYPSSSAADYSFNQPAGAPVPLGPPAEGIEAWFAVEPAGAVFLHINFQKQNIQRRAYEARLGRQGAFRKKKDDVAEINGHKFVSRQFYQIIRCALCGELLLNAAGSQCEDCRYTCHKKCAQKVVTKCISKSNAEADRDEVKINHRIPHRFEPITNIGANWCCHCGYILPFGRKNAKKCSECDITCHSDCAHLVPDFCGMSMEMANQLLSDIETINRVKHTAKQQQQQQTQQQRQQGQPQMPPKVGAQAPSQQQLGASQDTAYGYGAGRQQQQAGANGGAAPVGGPRPYDAPVDQLEQRTSQMDLASRPMDGPYGAAAASPARPRPPPVDPVYAGGAAPGPPQYGLPSQDGGASTGPQIGQVFNQQQYQQSEMAKPPRPLPLPGTAGRPMAPPPATQAPPPAQQQMQQQPLPPAQQARRPQPPGPGAMVPSTSASSQIVGAAPSQPPRNPPSSKRKIGLNDFNFLAVLGKGNFGKVMLAEEKRSGNLYAIKVLKKEFIIENDEVESTKSEKRVFLAAARERHPFLLGLHSCFQTETRVYFVMEYVSGGDLMLHIQKEQFSPKRAKFYAAEVLLALEYFHKQGIIYRDLKLDNIMLTLDGHVKVGDYGLCKEEMWYGNTTSTFCGTPEFMAPEILLEQRYGRAVDWWAFGILIYEMLLGQAPFRGDDEDEIFDAILEDEPLYPIHMPADSVSILHRLLTRDPAKRLGSGERDAEEIKAHPFFRDTNWDDMFHKRIPAPFKPTLKNPSDTSWFDAEFTSEKPTLTPVHSVLSAQDQEEFASFSWTSTTIL